MQGDRAVALVLAVDHTYVTQAATVLLSLATTQPQPIRTVVLHPGLPPMKEWFLRTVGDELAWPIELREVDEPRNVPVFGYISAATYLRLLAPALVEADRLLYLDADLLVQASLVELVESTPPTTLAATRDHFQQNFETGDALPGYRVGPSRTPYFNAGVLVVDRDRWQARHVTERTLRFLADHPDHIRYWDQCALNAVLEGHWTELDPSWNAFPFSDLLQPYDWRTQPEQPALPALLAVERKARILHFVGHKKPWDDHYPDGYNRRRYRALAAASRSLARLD